MCRLTFKEWGLYWDRLNAAVESQDSERIYAAKIAVKNDIRRIYIERYDRDGECVICGEKAGYFGLCKKCWRSLMNNAALRSDGYTKEAMSGTSGHKCVVCGSDKILCRKVCGKCYSLMRSHGFTSPEQLIQYKQETVVVPVDNGSEMDAYYRVLVSLGEGLLKEDHRKIKWGEARVAPDVRTLFHIWEDRPGLDMTVGFTEFNVPEEVAGKGKSGDYMMSVRAVGSKDSNGVMQYQASVSVFLECVKVGVFDYPFENDGLTSLTTAPNASENWAKLFDYVRFAKPMSESTTAQQGA